MSTDIPAAFEKCTNYSVLSVLVMNTIKAMPRFSAVPDDKIITNIYSKIKEKAAAKKS